jgi:hypothetical protein
MVRPFVSPLGRSTSSGADELSPFPPHAEPDAGPEVDDHGAESPTEAVPGEDLSWLAAIDWGDGDSPEETSSPGHATAEAPFSDDYGYLDPLEIEASLPELEDSLPDRADARPDVTDRASATASLDVELETPGGSDPSWMSWSPTEDDGTAGDSAAAEHDEEERIVEISELLEDEGAGDTDLPFLSSGEDPAASSGLDAIPVVPGVSTAAIDPLTELAGRLERVAATLRSGSLAEILSATGSKDPLEALLAGYALGVASVQARDSEDVG